MQTRSPLQLLALLAGLLSLEPIVCAPNFQVHPQRGSSQPRAPPVGGPRFWRWCWWLALGARTWRPRPERGAGLHEHETRAEQLIGGTRVLFVYVFWRAQARARRNTGAQWAHSGRTAPPERFNLCPRCCAKPNIICARCCRPVRARHSLGAATSLRGDSLWPARAARVHAAQAQPI